MIKRRLKSFLILSTFLIAPLVANEYTYEAKSLVGIEVGVSNVSSEMLGSTDAVNKDTSGNIALKIGGQTRNYRIYLNARYYADSNFDYITTYGVEGQYIFNFTKNSDFFIGIEGGMLNAKIKLEGENISRTLADPYFGGGAGFGYDIGDNSYLELGSRILNVDAVNINNNKHYQLNNIISAYISFVIKYEMD